MTQYFTRGHTLGAFSVELAKVNATMRPLDAAIHEMTIQAGWVAAFNTGDHWQLITELTDKIESAE